MSSAIQSVYPGDPITLEQLLGFHRTLLIGTRLSEHAGVIRTEQNWIGGSAYNPCSAEFIPPPPNTSPACSRTCASSAMTTPCLRLRRRRSRTAQFETIHPFVDGNGRTGRALIHLVLRRRGLATRTLPPVSLVLATWANDYVAGLDATRYRGPASSKAAHDGLNMWIGRFAAAAQRAVDDATSFEARTQALQHDWRTRLGSVRANSAADLLLRMLPGAPLVTVNSAAALIGRSFAAVNDAIARLTAGGILKQTNVGPVTGPLKLRRLSTRSLTWKDSSPALKATRGQVSRLAVCHDAGDVERQPQQRPAPVSCFPAARQHWVGESDPGRTRRPRLVSEYEGSCGLFRPAMMPAVHDGARGAPMSTGEWSGKGWTVTVTDTEMALAQASGSVTISGANAARLEVRRRWFRWRLLNEGQPLVRLRGITKTEAAALVTGAAASRFDTGDR